MKYILFFTLTLSANLFADCIFNKYAQEICEGDQVLLRTDAQTIALIKDIDYNIFTIKYENKKEKVKGDALIGRNDCNIFESEFCDHPKVKIKEECIQKYPKLSSSSKYKVKNLFYEGLAQIEKKSFLSTKNEIIETECLIRLEE